LTASSKKELEGTTCKVYLYVVREGKPVNARDVRRGANLSSPSVAFRHLQKLEELGLLEKNSFGDYVVKEKINGTGHLWVGRNLIPRLLMYCLFFIGLLAVEIVIILMRQSVDVNFIYLTALTVTVIVIFSAEGLLIHFNNKKTAEIT
jgi:hypothetical protein